MGKGFEKIPRQGKEFRNSRKLRKVLPIYKTNKLVLSQKYMSVKPRGSVPDLFSVTNKLNTLFLVSL